ncbi:RHS repeat domain-containing protein [Chitinophaga filiformis]|nr:RHS repeat domain-containing protein [Chitinophaga filiformis]
MKPRLLLLTVALLTSGTLKAQSNTSPLARITPPAPEAASISKYGIYPVSMFTGLPNISIPLYNIEIGDYSLPISLDYHSSGIKVDDLASCVGLGWNINAGGVITRTVMGVPDEDPAHGSFKLKIKREAAINETDYDTFLDAIEDDADTEPDIFSFNFGNKSGKFIISPDKEIRMVPHNNLKVRYDNGLFAITDDDGTIYKFEKTSYSTSSTEFGAVKYYPTTSWYLTTILLANKLDSITFAYSGFTPGRMETIDYELSLGKEVIKEITECHGDICPFIYWYKPNSLPMKMVTYENYSFWYVSNITFPSGKVDFTLNATRQDYGHILDKMTVTNINGNIIKQVGLTHSYFYNDQGYNVFALPQDKYRLKLTEVNEIGAAGTAPLKHIFQYEEQYQLPPRKNCGIDFWGYYNGKNTNEQLIPLDDNGRQYTFVDRNGMSDISTISKPADRTSNEDYMKAGMLKRIYYPTGGYTDFDFEANRIAIDKVVEKPGATIFVAAKKDDVVNDSTRYAKFISPITLGISSQTPATLTLNLPLWSDIKKPEIIFQNLTKGSFERYRTYPGDATFRTVNIALNEGDVYLVTASIFPNPNDPNDDTDEDVLATVKWPSGQNQTISVVQKGPGLRIKSIKNYTATGALAKQEDYRYGTNESGLGEIGFLDYLFSRRTYVQDYVYCLPKGTPGGSEGWISYSFPVNRLEILSRPIFGYSDFGGSSIFYPEVTKYEVGSGRDNGKTVYNYDYELDDKIDANYPEPQLLVSAGWKSGNLLSERKYKRKTDGTYQLVAESANEYSLYSIDTIYGLKVRAKTIFVGDGTCRPTQGNPHTGFELSRDFFYFEYPVMSGIKKITNTVNKNYSEDNTTMSAGISYTYNTSNFLPATITSKNSKGEIVKEVNKYPSDKASIMGLTAAESIAVDTMKARNMVSALIEKEQFIGDVSVALAHFEYNLWGGGNGLVGLKKNKVRLGGGAIQDMYEIFGYDEHGNMLERATRNGVHEVYLWGYNKAYPIAQVLNATYSSVSNLVSNAIIQHPASAAALDTELSKLRNVQLLPGVDVTTFTYEPLLGTTSIKDPSGKVIYYEYDSFSRLKTVRNADGKVLKFIDYQYQQPVSK